MDTDPKPAKERTPENIAVGARVRSARIGHGYATRKPLTDQLNLPRFGKELLGQVERGERVLHEHEAVELARVLEVDPDWLLYGAAKPEGLLEINAKLNAITKHLGIDAKTIATALAAVAGQSANGAERPRAPAQSADGQQTRRSAS